ncbi:unnamed protein product [Durusdinium trenchii]|uniref:Uncharacterized protein n=2 Tax=Durusdinium trenchii TaxID=1381693 RepID=A0ABP0JU25_9DINO
MVMGVSEGVLVNLERGLPFYIGIFFGSMLFFLGWNALNSFFLVGPAVATYVHHRTSGNRKNALTAVLFPANLIGLVVPALLGGLILFLVTTWPYPVACYTFYQRQRAAARSPDAEEPPPVAAGAEAKVVGVVDGEKEDAGGAQVGGSRLTRSRMSSSCPRTVSAEGRLGQHSPIALRMYKRLVSSRVPLQKESGVVPCFDIRSQFSDTVSP